MAAAASLQSSLSRRLTTQDASFLYGESIHGPMHIGSVSLFDGRLEFDSLVRQLEQRLHLIPRYRQRLNFVPFNLHHPTWEDDPTFQLSNHLKLHKLPPGTTEEQATRMAMDVHATILDRSRPLWEMHLFDALEDGRSLLLWKIHHCMVDGVSGIELSTVVMDFEPEPPATEPPGQPWSPASPAAPDASMVEAALDMAQQQIDAARRNQTIYRQPSNVTERVQLLTTAGRVISTMVSQPVVPAPWNTPPVTRARSLAWARMSFGEVRGIRGVLGGTVNDVVLALLSEGAGRYLQEHGVNVRGQQMRIGCPVNVRKEGESGALGNRVSMMFPTMPAEPMDPVSRLAAVRKETDRIKAAREPQALELMMESQDAVAPALMATASFAMNSASDARATFAIPQLPTAPTLQLPAFGLNFVATNVPGVQVPQYLDGKRMTDTIGLMPLGGNLGYGVAIGSYNQQLYIGMMAEPRVMPDVHRMKFHVEAAYADLLAVATAASNSSAAPGA
ncbi:hypothetical protein AYO38_02335 [bacterium SCGC AG-212-C10]|nr:hypothetical protein AYO38_02335 [bacterium SCGC AG-212-C10]